MAGQGYRGGRPGVRIIAGPRNTAFDRFVADLVSEEGYGRERTYFGITTPDRAETVRRRMKSAGQHLGVAVKAYWSECSGCANGGAGCRFHVLYTAYDMNDARAYRARMANTASKPSRHA